jgi:hypothetical protein
MKKLMILAAAAAMAGTVSAAEAQVYDAALTVKTTTCKDGKYTRALVNFPANGVNAFGYNAGDKVQFRKQATRKIAGVFWGCDCETIADPAWRVYTNVSARRNAKTVGGYAFWDATKSPYIPFTIPYVTFEWLVLNRIDQMKTVEGTWVLRDKAQDEALFLVGAGFGTVNNAKNTTCEDYIKNISGNFAGFMQYASGDEFGCVFCGVTDYLCLVAPFCWCVNADTTYLTAAYGTWSIKYNASSSKQLSNASSQAPYITDVKTFKGKAYTTARGTVSVAEALDAEEVAVLAAEAAGDSDWNWDAYLALDLDEKGNLVKIDKKGNATVIRGLYKIENKDLLDKTGPTYFGVLNTKDPGDVEDDPFFPENAKKFVDPS